jgi:uncharacterized membrane-anchored protein
MNKFTFSHHFRESRNDERGYSAISQGISASLGGNLRTARRKTSVLSATPTQRISS